MAKKCNYESQNEKYKCNLILRDKSDKYRCERCKDVFCNEHLISDPHTIIAIDKVIGEKNLITGNLCYECLFGLIKPPKPGAIRGLLKNISGKHHKMNIMPCINTNSFRSCLRDNALSISANPKLSYEDFISYMKDYARILAASYQMESPYDISINELLYATELTSKNFREKKSLLPYGLGILQDVNLWKFRDKIGLLTEGMSIFTYMITGSKLPAINLVSKEMTGKSIAEILYDLTIENIPYEIQRNISTGIAIKYIETLFLHMNQEKAT